VPYTSVSSLTSWSTVVAGPADLDEHGTPVGGEVAGVLPGDVIRIDYAGDYAGLTPAPGHVAVLYEDRSDPDGPAEGGADGNLDGFDLIAHMGHPQLKVEPLGDQCPMHLDVLRWDPDSCDPNRAARAGRRLSPAVADLRRLSRSHVDRDHPRPSPPGTVWFASRRR